MEFDYNKFIFLSIESEKVFKEASNLEKEACTSLLMSHMKKTQEKIIKQMAEESKQLTSTEIEIKKIN